MTAAAAMGKMATATEAAEGLEVSALHRTADRIATSHAAASKGDGAAFLRALAGSLGSEFQREEFARNRPHLERRGRAGHVRRLRDDAPQDILFDLAAPLAELAHDGHLSAANMLANRYLDMRPQGATGWAQLPLFVSLHAAALGDVALAEAMLAPRPPRLLVIGGLSGSGKSTLARLLGHRLGRGIGARVLRSDVFRKRLAGLDPETPLPPAHYTRQSDRDTYEAMFESADDHLACGSSVVLEAVFMSRSERDVAEAIALKARVPFTGIWLEAPERDRIARVVARTGDASDATEQVVREQSRRSLGEIHWHRIRTNRPIGTIVAAARGALDRVRR